jgi:hypothetical protein
LAVTSVKLKAICTTNSRPNDTAMAKCDLSIELDDPERVYFGGSCIKGLLRVSTEQGFQCDRLVVRTAWRTHGRGNVASGTGEEKSLFTGKVPPGNEQEFRFELTVPDWPPTYHGQLVNVDHFIDAEAEIAWAIDPKASALYLMRPSVGIDEASMNVNASKQAGCIGQAIGIAVLVTFVGFCAFAAINPFIWIIGGIVGLIALGIWCYRVLLPKYLLGQVTCTIDRDQVAPGDCVVGTLAIRPRRSFLINGIVSKFQSQEECVSGSGSNRTTHTHVLIEHEETLLPAESLQSDVARSFPFSVKVPESGPCSLDLTDNRILWSITIRIDIPHWPDWTQKFPLRVVPSGNSANTLIDHGYSVVDPDTTNAAYVSDKENSVSFDETVHHLWQLREQHKSVQPVVDAVAGLLFDMTAQIDRRLLYSGENDPHLEKDGYAVWATFPDPPLPMTLYVPHKLADDFEQGWRGLWSGQGTIVGWDQAHGRLQVRIDGRSGS